MKKIIVLTFFMISALSVTSVFGKPVSRISAEKEKDLSGNWNDKDIRIVCESIIDECINSTYIKKFTKKNNRLPYVKLGTILNLSDEYMDTTIIANKFRNAIINSGEMKFVASDSEVEALRKSGAKVVTLGNRILRTETVALSVASIIMYELEM